MPYKYKREEQRQPRLLADTKNEVSARVFFADSRYHNGKNRLYQLELQVSFVGEYDPKKVSLKEQKKLWNHYVKLQSDTIGFASLHLPAASYRLIRYY